MFIQKIYAAETSQAITNPAISGQAGDPAGSFGSLFANIWRAMIVAGGLALLLYLILGGVEWILAGGDKGKVEAARNKITQGLIGMAILAASVAIAAFISQVLGINLLNPVFFTAN